mgnify:FL=1
MASYDLSAAFDCIDADLLDSKLEHYGLDCLSRGWIMSFLSNRRQFIRNGTARSSTVQLKYGSPQGSIISPLLFIIYMADIDLWLSDGSAFSYADDTAAITFGESKDAALQKLETTSTELLKFFASNRLVANAKKTSLIVFRTPRSKDERTYSLNVGGSLVSESDSITLLGITLASDLSWTAQCEKVASSLRSINGLFSRLSKFTPNKFLMPLVHGLQLSKVRYGLPLFSNIRVSEDEPTSSSMRSLQVETNKGLRVVVGCTLADRRPVQDLVAEVNVPTVNQLAVEATLMDVWRQINFHLPAAEYFVPLENYVIDGRVTRRTGKGLLASIPCDESGAARFFQQGAMLWNLAPQNLRDEMDENKAKRLIRDFAREMPL